MRPLLAKTTRPFLIYVLLILAVSIPVYFVVVDAIWRSELDEHNRIIADKTAYGLNQLRLSEEDLKKSIQLWNRIQPGTNLTKIRDGDTLSDRVYTIEKQKIYAADPNIDRFRCLSTVIQVNGQSFRLIVETNIEETEETIAVIALVTLFFFLLIVAGLLVLNKRLSTKVWLPFRNTLDRLRSFNLNSHSTIEFDKTDTKEFDELNHSLTELIAHTVAVYQSQKEFTENASHELQTPLAILKNKLDLLLQTDGLTEKQYELAEEANLALSRSARINRNLLLLAKIENSQFDRKEEIKLNETLRKSLELLSEHFEQKQMEIEADISEQVRVAGNSSLTEILIHNLLLNAIRHTASGGRVSVKLTHAGLSIANSGNVALPSELLFRRFSRGSSEAGGSGLGLAIVREIVRFQGWTVSYRFENGFHVFEVKI